MWQELGTGLSRHCAGLRTLEGCRLSFPERRLLTTRCVDGQRSEGASREDSKSQNQDSNRTVVANAWPFSRAFQECFRLESQVSDLQVLWCSRSSSRLHYVQAFCGSGLGSD